MRKKNRLINVEELLPPRLQIRRICDELTTQLAVGPLNLLPLILHHGSRSSPKHAGQRLRHSDGHRRRREDAELPTARRRCGNGPSGVRRSMGWQTIKRRLLSVMSREAMGGSGRTVRVLEAGVPVEAHPQSHGIVRHGGMRMRMRMRMWMRVLRHPGGGRAERARRPRGRRRLRRGHAERELERVGPVRSTASGSASLMGVNRGFALPVGFALLLLRRRGACWPPC